ncbi:MAG: DUF2130 domain-containing protein [Bacilli bacterium]|nr:DUF2130 domain-containing protein [Bacilli bacterium]
MLEIKCPKCGEKIKLGKDEYNALLNDIEKDEVLKQVNERVEDIEKTYKAKYQLEANKLESSKEKQINELNNEINLLKERLSNSAKDVELAVSQAKESLNSKLSEKEAKIIELQGTINSNQKEKDLSIQKLKEQYEFELSAKDEQIKQWREFRLGDSTKDIGESLEQYCHDAFDEIRATAYPDAYFEKDNDVDEEGKGDFIFKDYQEGIEIVSIMFEMKNQKDTTKTKHKNEDFFAKLDRNRTSKKCEYAVLVSTLEEDSKLYNNGIVDVSHRYPKMYVVRPQFFLTIISLIRTMAKNSFNYKKQVVEYQRENIDVTNFENAVKSIADKINNDYDKASAIYSNVDGMCDDIIKRVEKFRDEFKKATGWVEKAKNQIPNLEVRKLTRGNQTMKEKFEELEAKDNK